MIRHPWADGTTRLAVEPTAFLERLAVLVPRPLADTEVAILEMVEWELLDASIFEDAIDVALDRLTRQQADAAGLVAERDRLARELGHLVDALARGGGVPSLVAELRARESRKADHDRQLTQPTVTREALRERLAERLADWRRLLRSRPTHGQRVLRTLLEGPIQIGNPTAQGVPWKAQGSLSGLLRTLSTCVASPSATASHVVCWLRRTAERGLPASGSQADTPDLRSSSEQWEATSRGVTPAAGSGSVTITAISDSWVSGRFEFQVIPLPSNRDTRPKTIQGGCELSISNFRRTA